LNGCKLAEITLIIKYLGAVDGYTKKTRRIGMDKKTIYEADLPFFDSQIERTNK
jgi:hypothetical protein